MKSEEFVDEGLIGYWGKKVAPNLANYATTLSATGLFGDQAAKMARLKLYQSERYNSFSTDFLDRMKKEFEYYKKDGLLLENYLTSYKVFNSLIESKIQEALITKSNSKKINMEQTSLDATKQQAPLTIQQWIDLFLQRELGDLHVDPLRLPRLNLYKKQFIDEYSRSKEWPANAANNIARIVFDINRDQVVDRSGRIIKRDQPVSSISIPQNPTRGQWEELKKDLQDAGIPPRRGFTWKDAPCAFKDEKTLQVYEFDFNTNTWNNITSGESIPVDKNYYKNLNSMFVQKINELLASASTMKGRSTPSTSPTTPSAPPASSTTSSAPPASSTTSSSTPSASSTTAEPVKTAQVQNAWTAGAKARAAAAARRQKLREDDDFFGQNDK